MNRIFFKTNTKDPRTNLPLYVFDTTFLPSPDLINYDQFIPVLLNQLPKFPYGLIFFSCGLNKISWIWGIRFLKKFLSNDTNLNNMHTIYMIHDSWYVRSITEIMKNIQTTKKIINLNMLIETLIGNGSTGITNGNNTSNDKSVIYCTDLSQLSKYIDITKIKISLNVYKFNYLLETSVFISKQTKTPEKIIGQDIVPQNYIIFNHFYQIFNILNLNGYKIEYLFHNPGNKRNCDILLDCINRDQIIWINDWDLYCIGTVFKKILSTLPKPLIPVGLIELPIQDSLEFTIETFNKILKYHQDNQISRNYKLILQIFNFCYKILENNKITKHTSNSLSKCLSSCMSHESIHHNKNNLLIINRFIKNIFENWLDIKENYLKFFESIADEIFKINNYNKDECYMNYELNINNEETNELQPPKIPPRRKRQYSDESESSISSSSTRSNTSPPPFTNEETLNDEPYEEAKIKSELKNAVSTPQLREASSNISPNANSNPSENNTTNNAETVKKQTSLPNLSSAASSPNKLNYKSGIEKFSLAPIEKAATTSAHKKEIIIKKPVIRGRKVGELTKLYEERLKGLEFINEL